jgi:prolyl-tRNA synthetase
VLIEHLIGKRLHDEPKDAQTPGHKILLRGGYIRQIGTGIFSLLPLGQRIRAKVEAIIREEMNAIGGQEIQMPVVAPADLWVESGRYDAVDDTLVRFKDRNGHPCVLNMTHEEVCVDLVRANLDSYRQFPFMVYQVQTKFRDEPRSRAGLIRVREFTMKDGYSFHRTQEDLEAYYDECHKAYVRIFRRIGMRECVDVLSDSGMMGGAISHEFMMVTPVGEDTLILCDACGYRANREVARARRDFTHTEALAPLTDVETPGQKTIEEVTGFLGTDARHACKAVAFVGDDKPIIAFVRGDYDVNPVKLKKAARAYDLRPMRDDEFEAIGSVAGYMGPVGLDPAKVTLLFDESVVASPNLVIGANKRDWHRTGFNVARDLGAVTAHDLTDVVEGDCCPECGGKVRITRGVEVGNIFQLGTKYSAAMGLTYHEEDGREATPIMGCYGIGVGRAFAAVAEESRDDNGPMWPVSIAPFTVQVCVLQAKKDEIRARGEALYRELLAAGVEALLDARPVAAGFMFGDADLIGAPIRVIVSPRNLDKGVLEVKYRMAVPNPELPTEIALEGATATIADIVRRAAEPTSFAGVRAAGA